MRLLFYKMFLRAPDGDQGSGGSSGGDPNVPLLLDKIKMLESKIEEQEKKIASVTDFNRRLLDGAKPATPASEEAQKKFNAYINGN